MPPALDIWRALKLPLLLLSKVPVIRPKTEANFKVNDFVACA